ncbi:MAG: hypothetical protein Q9218_007797 [Villophora microphyllina]
MTIGAIARSQGTEAGEENEDFVALRQVRDEVTEQLGLQQGDLELSMGMSQDFESAMRCGSDEVRVGSTVFGERPSRQDAKIKEDVEEGKGSQYQPDEVSRANIAADRAHEAAFHAALGDPYLDGPSKSTSDPEEKAAFHESIARLRARALASRTSNAEDPLMRAPRAPRGPPHTPTTLPVSRLAGIERGERALPQRLPDNAGAYRGDRSISQFPIRLSTIPATAEQSALQLTQHKHNVMTTGSKPPAYISKPLSVSGGGGRVCAPGNAPDVMERRLDQAVAERNQALAARRADPGTSRHSEAMVSSRGSSWHNAKFQPTASAGFIDSYRPTNRSSHGSSVEPGYPSRSENLKRSRHDMEEGRMKPSMPSSPEPAKKIKMDQPRESQSPRTRSLMEMTRLSEVETLMASLNRKLNALRTHNPTDYRTIERVVREKMRAHRRRDELDAQNKRAKGLAMQPMSVHPTSIGTGQGTPRVPVHPPSLATGQAQPFPPVAFSKAPLPGSTPKPLHEAMTEPHLSGSDPSKEQAVVMANIVEQITKVTKRISDLETTYPPQKRSRGAVTGLAYALISSTKKLMGTATNVAGKYIHGEVAEPTRQSRDTASAVEDLIAAARSPIVEQQSSKRRRASAAELMDEGH